MVEPKIQTQRTGFKSGFCGADHRDHVLLQWRRKKRSPLVPTFYSYARTVIIEVHMFTLQVVNTRLQPL